MKHRWLVIVGIAAPTLLLAQTARSPEAQRAHGPYARIAIMRALDGYSVELEAGYIRHLEWHRQANDPFAWYSYSVWASTERQRWIIYATFGQTAAELSNPVSPAEEERDNLINVLPHAQFLENGVYEFLPALRAGTVCQRRHSGPSTQWWMSATGGGKAFEAALASEQSKLQGETLWYRLVVGGSVPRYVRLRPRQSLASILL